MRLSLSGRKPPRAKHKENPSAMVKVSGVTHRIHESPPPKKKHIGRKKKMKVLIWNCRGIRKTGVSSYLKNLILEHQFHFIGLQETIVSDLTERMLENFDPHKNYLWKWIRARGRSGGILDGINIDKLDIGSFFVGKYMLQMNLWDK